MSQSELHDHLARLKSERDQATIEDGEYQMRLDEIIEALEQQALYPEAFDQYSTLSEQAREMVIDYESEHPTIRLVLESLQDLLRNFRS